MRRSPTFFMSMMLATAAAQAGTRPNAADFIASLADARADAATPADLSTLLRLQLAARRFAAAEATIDRLAERYRAADPGRILSLVPWRIYVRAMRHEAEGLSSRAALARAFAAIYAPLSDRDAAEAMAWYNPSMDRLRQAQSEAAAACLDVAVDQCPAAAQLVSARQAVTMWDYLVPASEPLIRADLERRYIVEDALMVPAADGAEVAAILIRPRIAPAAGLTALLAFTIYARDDWAMTDAAKMAAHGYAGMVAYSRGKGRGAGNPVPYRHDGADAAAVIEWLAARPWSDGRVGMFSGSYNASTQWAAARRRPPALRAIATHASNAPGTDTPMQGQVFQSFVYPWPLYTTERRGLDEGNYGDRARWAAISRIAAMAERRRRLYLTGAREGEQLRFGDAPQRGGAAAELRVDFADRSDADYQVPAGGIDTRSALVFATAPLAEAQEMIGGFSGRFEVVINKNDFDLSIALYEQLADGRYVPLHAHLAYLGRASFMADRSRRTLLRPGRVERLAFESQMIIARRLEAGSRIVAVVGVPKQPEIQINYGTGGDVSPESIADAGEPLRVTWRPGSWLEIGLRDAEPPAP